MAFISPALWFEGFNLRFVDIRIIANHTRIGMGGWVLVLPYIPQKSAKKVRHAKSNKIGDGAVVGLGKRAMERGQAHLFRQGG